MRNILYDYQTETTKRELEKLRALNLNYGEITEIDLINDQFQMIEELYLNHNFIENLEGIE